MRALGVSAFYHDSAAALVVVCTPEDAFRCLMGNELDLLVVGNCVLEKSEQNPALKQDYSDAFELD